MDRITLASARLIFFVMLFVSTACNKVDHNLLQTGFSDTRPAAVEQLAATESTRLHELEARVASLEAELQAANRDAQAGIPGGANWD